MIVNSSSLHPLIIAIWISVNGTIIDFIMLHNGEIKYFAGEDPTDEDSDYEELVLTTDEQNRVLKEFNELI